MTAPRRALLAALLLAAVLVPTTGAATATTATRSVSDSAASRPGVTREVYGHSVRGRPLLAYHLSPAGTSGPVVLVIAAMHGNEQAPITIARTLIDGAPYAGADLWVIPAYNPDGVAAHSRHNADGVDLNRNFAYHWTPLTGNYDSGPRPDSEPETRAMMRFLRRVRPDRILSFHQPLDGVDTDTKAPAFARQVARSLRLPRSTLDCGGVCHGTMTGWFNHHFAGTALTVEYGAHPGRRRMRVQAPRALLQLFGLHGALAHAQPLEPQAR